MAAPPYMKLYVGDYLGDTHHLGSVEHGAYLLLLMAMWRSGGSLPADDDGLARLSRCTPEQWGEIRRAILPFFSRSRGRLTHKRLASELAKYENTSCKRSEAGKRGGRKNTNDNNSVHKANAKQTKSNSRHNQNHNHNIDSEANASGGVTPEDPNRKAWSDAVGVLVDQGGMKSSAARAFFGGLLKSHGLEARDMLSAIGEALNQGTADPQAYLVAAAMGRQRRRVDGPARRVGFV